MAELTRILAAIESGQETATDELFVVVYDELRRLAARKLARESPGQTFQTTALVHEAYLRLVGQSLDGAPDSLEAGDSAPSEPDAREKLRALWQSRGHFFAAAAEAMRRILVENARRRGRLKRGGDRERVALEQVEPAEPSTSLDLLALNEALGNLEAIDKLKADLVKLRYFAGLTIEQTAAALGVSEATVKRQWAYSRAWLRRELSKGEELPDS